MAFGADHMQAAGLPHQPSCFTTASYSRFTRAIASRNA